MAERYYFGRFHYPATQLDISLHFRLIRRFDTPRASETDCSILLIIEFDDDDNTLSA